MNIKSLLLGSAVAAVAATGARAADAIVIAEPEPMEYVRICDVYGAGFFYIPGTQNCLKIGGYVRYQMNYDSRDQYRYGPATAYPVINHSYRFSKLARFAPTFDVRSETEWGTLRAFAEVEFDWFSGSWAGSSGAWVASRGGWNNEGNGYFLGGGQSVNLNHAFIELQTGNGTLRLGKGDLPWARFFGYGSGGIFAGAYAHSSGYGGFANSGELSYTFNNGSGFSAILALVEPSTGLFEPNIEAGASFAQGWGSVTGMVAYDNVNNVWGLKGGARINFAPVSVGAQVFYSSSNGGANYYGVSNPNGGISNWSVLGFARVAVSEKLEVKGQFQWFGASGAAYTGPGSGNQTWAAGGGLLIKPFGDSSLEILPEVQYINASADTMASASRGSYWNAAIRFNRNF